MHWTGLERRSARLQTPALGGGGKALLLSRPWRFGKSLLPDAVEELFEGNEVLERGDRGREQPRLLGDGSAHGRQRLPIRVQGGGADARRKGRRVNRGAWLHRQVPAPRPTHTLGWRGVQQRDPQPCGVRGGGWVRRGVPRCPGKGNDQATARGKGEILA